MLGFFYGDELSAHHSTPILEDQDFLSGFTPLAFSAPTLARQQVPHVTMLSDPVSHGGYLPHLPPGYAD
jgi:hypothetical protein